MRLLGYIQQQHTFSNEFDSKSRPIAIRQNRAFCFFYGANHLEDCIAHRKLLLWQLLLLFAMQILGLWLEKCMPEDDFSFGVLVAPGH